jgi:acetyl-CoA carboxylase carboxyl transferase subunit alpha
MAQQLRRAISDSLRQLQALDQRSLLRVRHERVMAYGKFKEAA